MTNIETKNHRFCLETMDFKQRIEIDFLQLGERLYRIREGRIYEPFWSDFDEFLMEMKISDSTASRLIGIWHKFVFQFKIATSQIAKAGGWSVVAEIMPACEDKRLAVHWLAKAQNLSVTDLRRELRESKSGIDMRDCDHDFYLLRCCRKCHVKESVHDQEK